VARGMENSLTGQSAEPVGVDFAAIYESQWWPMLRVALGLVDDVASAEDVTQDAFAALYRKLPTLRDPQAAYSYLRTSVVNGGRSTLRRRRTARSHSRPSHPDDAPPADATVLHHGERQAVRRVLASLPQRQREVLTLRLIGDLSDQEIAAATGLSHGNVRSTASRGLAALRASIGEQL
jgi:RNA polymerase sigma-70 factor (sigma-E family)